MAATDVIFITRVSVRGLFGTFDYDLKPKKGREDVIILYGDNGSGKTTLLRIVFHMLSSADDRGHRTKLASIPFNEISIDLSNRFTIAAKRQAPPNDDTIAFSIRRPGLDDVVWYFTPKNSAAERLNQDQRIELVTRYLTHANPNLADQLGGPIVTSVPSQTSSKPYVEVLSNLNIALYLISADRQIQSDQLESSGDATTWRTFNISMRDTSESDAISKARSTYLSQAMENATTWIRRQAVTSSNAGTVNVNQIYTEIVGRILNQSGKPPSEARRKQLIERLRTLTERNKGYVAFEFTPSLPVDELTKAIRSIRKRGDLEIVRQVLQPYFDGTSARLDALEHLFKLTQKFVSSLNRFLSYKAVSFSLTSGLKISNSKGIQISPEQLSSGEQQLLLLFCHTLSAHDRRSIFIIDEPELSLNVKWQRQLIRSLMEITEGRIQFLFATHSIELLSQHRQNVVQLIEHKR